MQLRRAQALKVVLDGVTDLFLPVAFGRLPLPMREPTACCSPPSRKDWQDSAGGRAQFVYNASTRRLSWDEDGDGSQPSTLLATFGAGGLGSAA